MPKVTLIQLSPSQLRPTSTIRSGLQDFVSSSTLMHPPSSPEALYHAISQDPEEVNSSEINLAPSSDDEYYPTDPPDIVVDRLIKIVHFILGCAVLLPWNGAKQPN